MLTARNLPPLFTPSPVPSTVPSKEGIDHRQHAAAGHDRVRQTDVPGLWPAPFAERLPHGLAGVDLYEGHPALRMLVERLLLFERQHLVGVDGLPRQEEKVRPLARLLVPNRSLGRYLREVGRAQVPAEIPDPAVALENRVRAGLPVDGRAARRDLAHPFYGRPVGIGEGSGLEPQRA